MKIGVCAGFDKITEAKEAGFEYIELPVSGTAAMTEEEFQEAKNQLMASGLPAPAFNLLFPGTMALLTTATDEEIRSYLDQALERVHELGGKVAVFGSGRSRNRPEEMSYGEAFRRLVEVTRIVGEAAAKHEVTIVIEPLNRKECNMINSVAEGACLAAMVDHPNVKVLADYYHVFEDQEPLDDMKRLGGVAHVHIAAGNSRIYPMEMEAGYQVFIDALKATGYEGGISVEGRTDDMLTDGPKAIRLLKQLIGTSEEA